uniref:Uncharacterized protein n=1 Tax=Candidatus Kentrum sp. LPFa TaxID=2126335 RepID=A0A450XTL7_9GAMM|nr:MAG: hypothetical protein BECKLPF1236A_GA0070988_101783 [Candidatus Kentron sp. LPFa]VFK32606.1 MAG: hypothetical protein BECKLPF1236C_GA0070990_101733 [Candidatus Kentron sp. LPFa]
MNKQVRQAALELMLLREKFTKKDLDEAFALVSNKGNVGLMEFLSTPPAKRPARQEANKKTRNVKSSNGLSNIVRELKDKDPERYELLADFDKKLRQETILSSLREIRKVGIYFSKEFQTGKSRKETIPRLMAILATVPLDDLKEKLDTVVEKAHGAFDDDSYQELARFLINGSRSDPQHHHPGSEEKRMNAENKVAMAGA